MARDYPTDLPPHDQLADEDDQLGWDTVQHGQMRDWATTRKADEPKTVKYKPSADPFLGEG